VKIFEIEEKKDLTDKNFVSIAPELIDTRRLRTNQDKFVLISNLFPFLDLEKFKMYGFTLLLNGSEHDWNINDTFSEKQSKLFTLVMTIFNNPYLVEKYGIYGAKSNKYMLFYQKQIKYWMFIYNYYYRYSIYTQYIYMYDKHLFKKDLIKSDIKTKILNFWFGEKQLKKEINGHNKLIFLFPHLFDTEYEKKIRLNRYKKLIYFFLTILE
jgi:hypothetical protein